MPDEVSPQPSRVESLSDAIFRDLYQPVKLGELLGSAETRSWIRKLPVPQLFFGLDELDQTDLLSLLPHITEDQWTGILDLELWTRDQAETGLFLLRARVLLEAEDAVARKLLRGTDPDLWQLAFKRNLQIVSVVDGEPESELGADGELIRTPDDYFIIQLPEQPDLSRLLQQLIMRLYQLDPQDTAVWIESSRARTSMEIEESAYENRRRRVESLGFQDYFEALSIYVPIESIDGSPRKRSGEEFPVSQELTVPKQVPEGNLLLFEAGTALEDPDELQLVLEELFFISNKLVSADGLSPGNIEAVHERIEKAAFGINLGLDAWAKGNIETAAAGLRNYFVQSFFRHGYWLLLKLQQRAQRITDVAPGTSDEIVLNGLRMPYPVLSQLVDGKTISRWFKTRQDCRIATETLERLEEGMPGEAK